MAWIESHQEIKDHPKTHALMMLMGWDLDTCIAKLHRFWWWCVDYAPDGDLLTRKYNDSALAMAVGLRGDQGQDFVNAMVAAGWLDRSKGVFRVHDWWDYIGRYLRQKWKDSPEKWQAVKFAYSTSNGTSNGTSN